MVHVGVGAGLVAPERLSTRLLSPLSPASSNSMYVPSKAPELGAGKRSCPALVQVRGRLEAGGSPARFEDRRALLPSPSLGDTVHLGKLCEEVHLNRPGAIATWLRALLRSGYCRLVFWSHVSSWSKGCRMVVTLSGALLLLQGHGEDYFLPSAS